MPDNAPHRALTATVNRMIAEGNPVITAQTHEPDDHGKSQAVAQLASIAEMLEAFYTAIENDDSNAEDEARDAIQCDPLSVEVRGEWIEPGPVEAASHPVEFRILLCTGGPAVQIRGELDEHCEPRRAWIEYQDWFTPWTQLLPRDFPDGATPQTLIDYANHFWFGA